MQNIGTLKPCHLLLKQPSENVLFSHKKIVGLKIKDTLIDEDHLGQVKLARLFKVTVLNLHVILIKPKIKLIISKLELLSFKISQLSFHVFCRYGVSVHTNNYDTSHRQKRFHAI